MSRKSKVKEKTLSEHRSKTISPKNSLKHLTSKRKSFFKIKGSYLIYCAEKDYEQIIQKIPLYQAIITENPSAMNTEFNIQTPHDEYREHYGSMR